MDQNINSDGTPAGTTGVMQSENANKYSLVAWNSSDSNTGGPIDAMQFLYNATKDWPNIDPLNYEYKDREYHGISADNTTIGYTSFVSKDGVLTITPLSGTATTIGTSDYPLKARMPIYSYNYSTAISKGEVASKTTTNAYLYDNLVSQGSNGYGYWTISSFSETFQFSYSVVYDGYIFNSHPGDDTDYGVRPVINLKI